MREYNIIKGIFFVYEFPFSWGSNLDSVFVNFNFYSSSINLLALTLYGNLELCAHVCSEIGNLICENFFLFISRAVANLKFILEKIPFPARVRNTVRVTIWYKYHYKSFAPPPLSRWGFYILQQRERSYTLTDIQTYIIRQLIDLAYVSYRK